MTKEKRGFDPSPKHLYTFEELFKGFDPRDPVTYADTLDMKIYAQWIARGGAVCSDPKLSAKYATHDNAITLNLARHVRGKKIVGVMGGHEAKRGDDAYTLAARLSLKLKLSGYEVATGGGPGVMEACHLGAMCANEAELDGLLEELTDPDTAAIPAGAGSVVSPTGIVDEAIATKLGEYLVPAFNIRKRVGRGGGLGIPTWLYGYEPPTPLAQSVAKYFQNSIREDGLLALATHGVIYMKGSAGTLQEVFQDAAQNYYHTFPKGRRATGEFSPMVFAGGYWRSEMPIEPVLKALVGNPSSDSAKPNQHRADYDRWVRFLDEPDAIIAHLDGFAGVESALVAAAA